MANSEEKSFDELIQDFIDYQGNKKFHIDGGYTISPNTPNEQHVPMKVIRGPLKSELCRICNEPLEPIHQEQPKRRALHYCSSECRKEHEELEKLRKNLGAEMLLYKRQKPPIDRMTITYTIKGEGGVQHRYKARKSGKNYSKFSNP